MPVTMRPTQLLYVLTLASNLGCSHSHLSRQSSEAAARLGFAYP